MLYVCFNDAFNDAYFIRAFRILMPLAYRRIGGPKEAHGVKTAEDYRTKQAEHIAACRQALPDREWRTPWIFAGTHPQAVVNWGRWVVECPCGNCPSASDEWNLALCFECGAIYNAVSFPDHRDEISRALMTRPRMEDRCWRPESLSAVPDKRHAR